MDSFFPDNLRVIVPVVLGILGFAVTKLKAEISTANCSEPQVGPLVTIHDMSDENTQRVHLTCPDFFGSDGFSVLKCIQQNGSVGWNHDPLQFICDYPCNITDPLPEGLSVSPSTLIWSGEDVAFSCTKGILPGDAPRSSRCQNGTLSPPIPSCNLNHGNIRLKNGRVMVTYGDVEGSICFTDQWDIHNANVVCRQLGLSPYALSYTKIPFEQTNDLIHFDSVRCQGYEDRLIDCGLSSSGCPSRYYGGVVCLEGDESANDGAVRLIKEGGLDITRVELHLNDVWGAICAGLCNTQTATCKESWTLDRASWFCQELGYPRAVGVGLDTAYEQGEDPMIFLECPADAESLRDCTKYYLGTDLPCDFGTLYVTCEKPDEFSLRLINGSDKNEGRLEMFDGNHWRTVPPFNNSLTPQLICEELTGRTQYVQSVDGAFGNGLVMPKYTYSCPEDAVSLGKCNVVRVSDDDVDEAPVSLYCNQATETVAGWNPLVICWTAFAVTMVVLVVMVSIRMYYHKKRVQYHRMGSHVTERYDDINGGDCEDANETEMQTMKSNDRTTSANDEVFND